MEAEWDPVAKKVVYRNQDSKPSEEPQNASTRQQPSWRDDPTGQKASSPSRRRQRSYGVKPSHPVPKNVEDFRNNTTMSEIRDKTQLARACYDRQRRVYHELSSYKSYPWQELAIVYLHQLQKQWGIEPDEEVIRTTNLDADSCSSTTTSSSISVLPPEPKRRGNLDQSIQDFKDKLLQQREPSPDSHVFANPLYSLEPRIWSIEAATTGTRRYVVAHAGRFFDQYWRKTIPADRHAYELIRPNTPCRLYLDIECRQDEFLIASGHLQDELLYELWLLLAKEVEERFQEFTANGNHLAPLNRQDHLLDLESNSSTKFSRHWIFHLKTLDGIEVLFPNNLAVGRFVKGFISRLADDPCWHDDYPVLSKYLFLGKYCLLDLGVYTRNRVFRLLGSCKYGKSAALHIAQSNQFDLGITNDCTKLCSDTPVDKTNIDEQVQEAIRRTADWSDHAWALAQTLVVPLNSTKFTYPLLPIALEESNDPKRQQSPRLSPTAHVRGQSKYPAIEEYILERFGDRGGSVGRVRVWSIFEDRLLSFHMMDNRWCEHVGRQHKSNNIVWNVDLVSHTCYQTCHDPDCRGFRGEMFAIPDELFETDHENLEDDEFFGDDEFEEALAALNIDDVTATFASSQKAEAVQKPEGPSPTSVLESLGPPVNGGSQFAAWLDSDDSSVDERKKQPQKEPLYTPTISLSEAGQVDGRDFSVASKDLDGKKGSIVDCSNGEEEQIDGDGTLGTNSCHETDCKPELSIETSKEKLSGFASWLDSPDNADINDQVEDRREANDTSAVAAILETKPLETMMPRDSHDSLHDIPKSKPATFASSQKAEVVQKPEGPSPTRVLESLGPPVNGGSQFAAWLDSDDSSVDERKKQPQKEPLYTPTISLSEAGQVDGRDFSVASKDAEHGLDGKKGSIVDCSNGEEEQIDGDGTLGTNSCHETDSKSELSIESSKEKLSGFASWLDSPDNADINDQGEDRSEANDTSAVAAILETKPLETMMPRDSHDSLHDIPKSKPTSETREDPSKATVEGEESASYSTGQSSENCSRHENVAELPWVSQSKEGEKGFAYWLDSSPDNEQQDEKQQQEKRETDKFASWLDSDSSDD